MAMNRATPRSRRHQGGFTLIEVAFALIVMMVAVGVGIGIASDASDRQEAAATGDWLRVVASAAKAYEKANHASLAATAGPATPVTITADHLASYLPPGFSTTSPQGHTFSVRWIQPTAGTLQGMVILQDGDDLTGRWLLQVASQAGGGAGYVNPNDAAEGRGPRGTWSASLASWGGSPGAGKPLYALFYDNEAAGAENDYLNRTAIPGKPEVNRMNTAINMDGNNIDNAGNVSAASLEALDGLTANQIAIGKAAHGSIPYPYETIQTRGDLSVRFAAGTRQLAVFQPDGTSAFNGSVTANQVHATDHYANNGRFITKGNGGWYSETHGGGWYMNDASWIRAYNGKNIYTDGYIYAGGNAVSGQSCYPWGMLGREASNGRLMSCRGGVWRPAGGLGGTTIVHGPGQSQGPVWAYAYCPSGTFLVGGGYQAVYMQKESSQEAPQINIPDAGRNAWAVYAGGSSGGRESRFEPYAVCAY